MKILGILKDIACLLWLLFVLAAGPLLIAILAHVPVIRDVLAWFLNMGAGA